MKRLDSKAATQPPYLQATTLYLSFSDSLNSLLKSGAAAKVEVKVQNLSEDTACLLTVLAAQ